MEILETFSLYLTGSSVCLINCDYDAVIKIQPFKILDPLLRKLSRGLSLIVMFSLVFLLYSGWCATA